MDTLCPRREKVTWLFIVFELGRSESARRSRFSFVLFRLSFRLRPGGSSLSRVLFACLARARILSLLLVVDLVRALFCLYLYKREELITFPAATKYFSLWSGLSWTACIRVW